MPQSRIRHFMTESVLTATAATPLPEVAALMSTAAVSCVVVVEENRPVGVITERDITRAYASDLAVGSSRPASSVMSSGVRSLRVDARCDEAVALCTDHGIRRLVVVDENDDLRGIITQSDLLRAHTHEVEIQKELLEQRVAERTRELHEANARLESLARIDPMLGIGNRRAMDDELERLQNHVSRYRRPYAVVLLDVDHFKRYNDHYGHAEGDTALQQVAGTIRRTIRGADGLFRYGGEEFLAVFPEVGADGAAIAAEHVRAAVEALAVPHEHSPFGHLSISLGVAGENLDEPCWSTLLTRADEALYRAKALGRNRVEVARDGAEKVAPAA